MTSVMCCFLVHQPEAGGQRQEPLSTRKQSQCRMHPIRKEASAARPSWPLPVTSVGISQVGCPTPSCGPLRAPLFLLNPGTISQPEPESPWPRREQSRGKEEPARTGMDVGWEMPTAGLDPTQPPGARPASCLPPRIARTSSSRRPGPQPSSGPAFPHLCPWSGLLPRTPSAPHTALTSPPEASHSLEQRAPAGRGRGDRVCQVWGSWEQRC